MTLFFNGIAVGIVTLNEKLIIQAIVGEMADVMERIRYGALDHRSLTPKDEHGIDPESSLSLSTAST